MTVLALETYWMTCPLCSYCCNYRGMMTMTEITKPPRVRERDRGIIDKILLFPTTVILTIYF